MVIAIGRRGIAIGRTETSFHEEKPSSDKERSRSDQQKRSFHEGKRSSERERLRSDEVKLRSREVGGLRTEDQRRQDHGHSAGLGKVRVCLQDVVGARDEAGIICVSSGLGIDREDRAGLVDLDAEGDLAAQIGVYDARLVVAVDELGGEGLDTWASD